MHRPHGPATVGYRQGLVSREKCFSQAELTPGALQKRATQVKVHSLVACNTASYKA